MTRIRTIVVLAGLPLLAACATPLQTCVADTTVELRRVQADIERVSGNIDRGYAIHRQTVTRPQVGFCGGFGRYRDPVGIHVSGCRGTDHVRLETPVPVDIDAEKQKLADLRARELTLQAQTQPGVAACYQRFGNG